MKKTIFLLNFKKNTVTIRNKIISLQSTLPGYYLLPFTAELATSKKEHFYESEIFKSQVGWPVDFAIWLTSSKLIGLIRNASVDNSEWKLPLLNYHITVRFISLELINHLKVIWSWNLSWIERIILLLQLNISLTTFFANNKWFLQIRVLLFKKSWWKKRDLYLS